MAFCSRCGASVSDEVRFCSSCGTPRTSGGVSTGSGGQAHPAQSPSFGSLGKALDDLGVGHLKTQIFALVLAWVTGMIVARILPYVYDSIFGRITSLFIGTEITAARDNFNTWLMTLVTLGASFVVGFFAHLSVNYAARAFTAVKRAVSATPGR